MRTAGAMAACGVLAALSVVWSFSLTYDAWAWSVWARELTQFDLDLSSPVPAWKPLPVLVLAPFSRIGQAAPLLWLVVARTAALLAIVLAYRLARRIGGILAGVIATAGLLLSIDFIGYLWALGVSEAVLAALVLWAIESHLDGHLERAWLIGFAAALLRPEVWPFWLLYALFLARARPPRRAVVLAVTASLPVLWFGPDLVVGHDLLRSFRAGRAPAGALAQDVPWRAVLRSARHSVIGPVQVGAMVAVGVSLVGFVRRREDAATAGLALAGVSWLALIVGMAAARVGGGMARFLVVTTALGCVLAGIGWSWIIRRGSVSVAEWLKRPSLVTPLATAVICVGLVASLVLAASPVRHMAGRLRNLQFDTQRDNQLPAAIRAAGGAKVVLDCGPAWADKSRVAGVAWALGVHLGDVHPLGALPPSSGVVFLTPEHRSRPALPTAPTGFHTMGRTTMWDVAARCEPVPDPEPQLNRS